MRWKPASAGFFRKTTLFVSLAFMLLATVTPHQLPVVAGQTSPAVLGVWVPQKNSNVFNDTSLVAGNYIIIDVNITKAPITNAFDISLVYDQNVLQFVKADVTTNTIFGSDGQIVKIQIPPQMVEVVAAKFGQVWPGGSGILVHFNFTVIKQGVSPLALYETQLVGGPQGGDPVEHTTADGYFTNSPQRGPVAAFTVSPARPVKGQEVTLNATASIDPKNPSGPNKGINNYDWYYGSNDGSGGQSGPDIPVLIHVFGGALAPRAGVFWVRLIVSDSAGNRGVQIIRVTVVPPVRHDMRIVGVSLTSLQVVRGQNIGVRIIVDNFGDFSETFNVTLKLEQNLVQEWDNYSLPVGGNRLAFNSTIKTADLIAGIYNVVATVVVKQDDDLSNNTIAQRIRVKVQQASELPFLIAIPAVAAAIGGGIFVARRIRSKPSEGPGLTSILLAGSVLPR